MFWYLEAAILETLSFAPEFFLICGAPELPGRNLRKLVSVRRLGRRTELVEA